MHASKMFLLALVAGASAGACPASVGSGAQGFAELSACGADSCKASMRVPLGEAFALCDPCQGEVGMQAIVTMEAGEFTLIPTGLGATQMKAGECVAGLMLTRDAGNGRGAVALQNAQNNVTWTVPSTDAPIATPVGSFEPVRFCTDVSKCRGEGDSEATCDVAGGQCQCSQGFNGKTCKPVGQPETPIDTVLVSTFLNAICNVFKNNPAMIKQALDIIAEVSGAPVLAYTIQCGKEPETAKTPQGRGAQALQEATGVVVATHAKILPSKVDAVTTGMATEVADKVAQAPALKEVLGTQVEGRATLVESEATKCALAHATVQVQKVVDGVITCAALACEVGHVKSASEPSTCVKAEDRDQTSFVCLVDADCTFDASKPLCGAEGQCSAQVRGVVSDDDDLSTGAIVALSVGLTAVFFLVVGGIVYTMMSKNAAAAEATAHHPENEDVAPENVAPEQV